VFDEASVKVYVTKVVPIGKNVVPGVCDLDEKESGPEQLSFAVGSIHET
jgi:hypothetical protein